MLETVMNFAGDPAKMLAVTSSIMIAVLLLLAYKRFEKVSLLYAHLVFVLAPLFYFALSINCSFGFAKSLLAWCTLIFAKAVIYLLPVAMASSFVAGYIFIPRLYEAKGNRLNVKWFNQLCVKHGVSASLFVLDKARPLAFTGSKSVFVSVGLFDLLSKKEVEAVVLHELYHVKNNSAWNKFSASFTSWFSPLAMFSGKSDDERAADTFAAKSQKTWRFVKSAHRKVDNDSWN